MSEGGRQQRRGTDGVVRFDIGEVQCSFCLMACIASGTKKLCESLSSFDTIEKRVMKSRRLSETKPVHRHRAESSVRSRPPTAPLTWSSRLARRRSLSNCKFRPASLRLSQRRPALSIDSLSDLTSHLSKPTRLHRAAMAEAVPAKPSEDLVLGVFLHGFKGGADTSVGSVCESQSRET